MSNNLSAKTVFHFTSNPKRLESILKNKFYARYCVEDIFGTVTGKKQDWHYVPMICFCDIPLSMVKNHCSLYGKYGIGLSKDWARRKRINPVLYTYKHSTFMSMLARSLSFISKSKFVPNPKEHLKLIRALFPSFQFIKPYRGMMPRNNKKIYNVNFYDEKEWRYVPIMPNNWDAMVNQSEVGQGKKYTIESLNRKLKKNPSAHVEFTLNDIKFIIVQRDSEIPQMIRAIHRIFSSEKIDNRLKLISKIISVKQLDDNF